MTCSPPTPTLEKTNSTGSAPPYVVLDGALRRLEEARVPIRDYGFLYGAGVFETMRYYPTYGIVALNAHLARLRAGIEALDQQFPASEDAMRNDIRMLLEANGLLDRPAVIKILVSLGPGPLRPHLGRCGSPTTLVIATAYVPAPEEGYHGVTAPSPHSEHSPLVRLKTLNFLAYLLIRHRRRPEASSGDGTGSPHEVLLIDAKGRLCEGTTSNLFFVRRGVLCTPSADLPLLNGITRQRVLAIAREEGIPTETGHYTIEDLLQADEAFLTNSVIEIAPLLSIDGRPCPSGRWTRTLKHHYQTRIPQDACL